MIVGTKGAIPYTLPPTNPLISLIPDLQMDVKRTIWKGHKVYKQDKQEERRKFWTGKLEGVLSITLSFSTNSKWRQTQDERSPPTPNKML